MKKYVIALDQGTTSSRAILFDHEQCVVGTVSKEFPQIYPKEGWVEHDPDAIWETQSACMTEVIRQTGVTADEIAAVGITNQRETAVVWNRKTGRPVYNAIVWQCRRTADIIESLKPYHGLIREKTGLVPDAYFSGSKVKWILDHVPGAREQAERGELAFGNIDAWLIWNLTGGKVHATDRTNACRTMLYDIEKCRWDEELCSLLTVPMSMLPEVKSSSELYGYTEIDGTSIPVCGVAGDQQSALFGQGCFHDGDAKNTYGTGCFLLMNTGTTRRTSENGLLCTIAATTKDEPVQYALEGSVFCGGSVIQWLRDEMRFFSESREVEALASQVEDTAGVYLVPAFTGLGAPYWDMYARGSITGITRGTKREHIIRAAEESIAYQSADLIAAMEKDTGETIPALRVDGGATRDNFLMQFQSDVLDKLVIRPVVRETTALGAARLAGLAVGFWQSKDELNEGMAVDREFTPSVTEEKRQSLMDGWHRAVERTLSR